MIFAFFRFLYNCLGKVKDFILGVPGKISVLMAGLSVVIGECVAFIEQITTFFTEKSVLLQQYFVQFVDSFTGGNYSDLLGLLVYCLAFDVLVTIVSDIIGFLVLVFTFLFVTFVHAVLIFLGLKFGYQCYKFMVRAFSNGLSKI